MSTLLLKKKKIMLSGHISEKLSVDVTPLWCFVMVMFRTGDGMRLCTSLTLISYFYMEFLHD